MISRCHTYNNNFNRQDLLDHTILIITQSTRRQTLRWRQLETQKKEQSEEEESLLDNAASKRQKIQAISNQDNNNKFLFNYRQETKIKILGTQLENWRN